MKKFLLAALLCLLGAPAWATCTTIPFVFSTGLIFSSQINSDFSYLGNCSAAAGANSDITSLSGLTTPLSEAQGGTGQITAAAGPWALKTANLSDVSSALTSLNNLFLGVTGLAAGDIFCYDGTNIVHIPVSANLYLQGRAGACPQYVAGTVSAPGTTVAPQGRLTLTSGVPVAFSNVTSASTVYYDSYVGNQVPVWNGAAMVLFAIGADEISLTLNTSNHLANKIYDAVAFSNSGTLTLCTLPAWTNGTTRSAAIVLKSGIWTNTAATTHCFNGATDYGVIAASQGTYVGTVAITATNAQTAMQTAPAAAAGGSNNFLGVYNAYNRVTLPAKEINSDSNWSYSTAVWQPSDGGGANVKSRITYIDGLGQSPVSAILGMQISYSSAGGTIGINLNSTSATPAIYGGLVGSGNNTQVTVQGVFAPVLGQNYVQAMEISPGAAAGLFAVNPNASIPVLTIQVPM